MHLVKSLLQNFHNKYIYFSEHNKRLEYLIQYQRTTSKCKTIDHLYFLSYGEEI